MGVNQVNFQQLWNPLSPTLTPTYTQQLLYHPVYTTTITTRCVLPVWDPKVSDCDIIAFAKVLSFPASCLLLPPLDWFHIIHNRSDLWLRENKEIYATNSMPLFSGTLHSRAKVRDNAKERGSVILVRQHIGESSAMHGLSHSLSVELTEVPKNLRSDSV
jgi:hypothetical protein